MDVIQLDTTAQAHIQAYIEYKNIVGDTDGGKLLSEAEFAKRKKKALRDQANRIYVTWLNSESLECRAVGPSSKCLCGHKFRDHDSCNKQKRIRCKMAKCRCKCFEYIPIRGSQDLKCHCKHSYKFHSVSTRKCSKRHPVKGTCACSQFISSFGCACGEPYSSHHTLFETREERQKAGKRVDNLAMGGTGCASMGGITTFSSLLDGVDRMSIQQNNAPISDLQLQFMRPRTKLSEQEEMAIYAGKWEKKPSQTNTRNPMHHKHKQLKITAKKQPMNVSNKLKFLKQKQKRQNIMIRNHRNYDQIENKTQEQPQDDVNVYEFQQNIIQLEDQLKDNQLSAATKYALNKKLKIEKSKIIRYRRKKERERKQFEKGML